LKDLADHGPEQAIESAENASSIETSVWRS